MELKNFWVFAFGLFRPERLRFASLTRISPRKRKYGKTIGGCVIFFWQNLKRGKVTHLSAAVQIFEKLKFPRFFLHCSDIAEAADFNGQQ